MVRDRNALWNMKSNDYKKKDLKESLWIEIAVALSGNFSGEDIKEKWMKLRESFSKHKIYIPSGSASKSVKPHKYAEQMSFINDTIGHKK